MANEKVKARVIPNNKQAEQSVLGCALIEPNAAGTVMGTMNENMFYTDVHKMIFRAMRDLYVKGTTIDFITLSDIIEQQGNMNKIGGIGYLTELTNIVPSAANVMNYINIVSSDATLRELITKAQAIIDEGYGGTDAGEALSNAEKYIYDIAQKHDRSALEHVSIVTAQAIERVEMLMKDKSLFRGLKTGFKGFDELTNGLQKSDLLILAARPGIGKTAYALNIATNVALAHSAKVAIFSLEMPSSQLVLRMLSSLARVPMKSIRNGELSNAEMARVWEAEKKLSAAEIYIDDSSVTKVPEILSKCRRLDREANGLDLIVVDYLQLMSSEKKSDNRQTEVAEISRGMKILARELKVPVILLSQLSRDIEKRTANKSPQLSDLRESGAIEQDADIVMFLSKDEQSPEESEQYIELKIAKHRNGPIGDMPLVWEKEFVTFRSAEVKPKTKIAEPTTMKKIEVKTEPKQAEVKDEELPF